MAKIYGTPIMAGGAGGVSDTLPPMVTNLAAVAGNQQITVTYKNPVSDALAGVLVVYKTGSYPTKPTDGNKVDAGLSEKAILEGLENGADYYIRVFPYNAKKQYQTLIDGATTTARPSEGPKQVTDLKVTGSGSSPVLSWKNPTDDPTYHETVVIQKVDSAPTSLSDGTEIYRGTGETVSANGLERLKNYYWGVFTVNAEGGTRGPVITEVYSFDFPEEPTEYTALTEFTSSNSYVIPEMGWFRIDAIARSGDGGHTVQKSGNLVSTPGGGGTGGHSRSEIAANKGDIISIKIQNGDITISSETIENLNMSSSHGSNGIVAATASDDSRGGPGGTANGGNKINETGLTGSAGRNGRIDPGETYAGGSGAAKNIEINSSKTHRIAGGNGQGIRRASSASGYSYIKYTTGTEAIVFISRGNTNIPSPSAASTLSLTPRNTAIEASWTNSQDPESVGTIVVVNSDHEPVTPEDGSSVDVAGATTYTISDLPNDTPTYVSLFAYNADKTKYSAAKSDVEIPREVTWADTQDALEQDVEEKTEQLLAEVKTMASAGISQVKAYCEATSNAPMADVGVFAGGVEEWKAGVEYKLNDLFTYQGNMGYVKQPTLTSLDVYPPFSVGTEALYGARPNPDADGIYPYVYNMGIYKGMLVRDDDGVLYRSIIGTQERPTELLYHPKDVPTLLEKVEEGGEEAPSEEYPE